MIRGPKAPGGRQELGTALAQALASGSVRVVIDATALKVYGAGEWLVEKHSKRSQRTWRKLHLAVDPGTGEIFASELISSEEGDAPWSARCSASPLAPTPQFGVRAVGRGLLQALQRACSIASICLPGGRTVMADEGFQSRRLARDLLQHDSWWLRTVHRRERVFHITGLTWIAQLRLARAQLAVQQGPRLRGPDVGSPDRHRRHRLMPNRIAPTHQAIAF